jgi:glutamate/tyrosine decarboxylase-like PLP-dependent enzyme
MEHQSTHAALELNLSAEERSALWQSLSEIIEGHYKNAEKLAVSPDLNPLAVRNFLASLPFDKPLGSRLALEKVKEGLEKWQVHLGHPMYYGLFNPRPSAMGIVADALVAAYNPQMAAWSHSPFAVEVENYVIRELGKKFGMDADKIDGTFCSGGAEANQSAVLTALVAKFPEYATKGVRALPGQPVLYASEQSHHSLMKAARTSGLGSDTIRMVPSDSSLKMDLQALRESIADDKKMGFIPFMVAGTAGTTGAGVIDPLPEIAEICKEENLWFHADAAWGGAAALVPELKQSIAGIELADSITFDAHKWFSVPMGAGIYLTKHPEILQRTFAIHADYMPKEGKDLGIIDPFGHSIQWSRRFTGLKVYMSLLVAGWEGYEKVIRHQSEMGNELKIALQQKGWEVVNQTPFPLACFRGSTPQTQSREYLMGVCDRVVKSGKAWISTIALKDDLFTLRACITNYASEKKHIHQLVELLEEMK